MMKTITVFTPTYNRAFCLPQVYNSLVDQTSKDFDWLIIDDGSTDQTEALVKEWMEKNQFKITYFKQKNKGMLGAHNTAHSLIHTELTVCIDSDDYLSNDAIEKINVLWKKYRNDTSLAGVVGLDCYKNGQIIGDEFAADQQRMKYRNITKVNGDKKYVYKTEVLKEFGPYPVVQGEKFPAQGYLYRKIDSKYDLIAVNEVFCVVEYLPDGNSFNKISSYLKNPNSFILHRILMMETSENLKEKLRQATHYVSSCFISKKIAKIFFNKFFYLTIPAIPSGLLLYIYLKNKKGGMVNKKLNS